jgi:hypothetical protein
MSQAYYMSISLASEERYLVKKGKIVEMDNEAALKQGLDVRRLAKINAFLSAGKSLKDLPVNVPIFVFVQGKFATLIKKGNSDIELTEVSYPEALDRIEKHLKSLTLNTLFPPLTLNTLKDLNYTHTPLPSTQNRYNLSDDCFEFLCKLAPKKDYKSLIKGDFLVFSSTIYRFIDLKTIPEVIFPHNFVEVTGYKPSVQAPKIISPVAEIIKSPNVVKVIPVEPVIIQTKVETPPIIPPETFSKLEELKEENAKQRKKNSENIEELGALKSKWQQEETSKNLEIKALKEVIEAYKISLEELKAKHAMEIDERIKATQYASSLTDEQFNSISFKELGLIEFLFTFDTKLFFFNIDTSKLKVVNKYGFLQEKLEIWLNKMAEFVNGHISNITSCIDEFRKTLQKFSHEKEKIREFWTGKTKKLKKTIKTLRKDITYLESQISETHTENLKRVAQLKLEIQTGTKQQSHELEYNKKVLVALEVFEKIAPEKNKLIEPDGSRRWLCFSKGQLRHHFENKYKMSGFLDFDPKEINEELSKHMFTILEYLCHKTGSKSILWYGHYLNKIFNRKVANKYPKTEKEHIQRYYETWGKWAGFELNFEVQTNFEKGGNTLENLHYAHMLSKINCQRFAFRVLDFFD